MLMLHFILLIKTKTIELINHHNQKINKNAFNRILVILYKLKENKNTKKWSKLRKNPSGYNKIKLFNKRYQM